ncbi:MAG: hypothetical protein U9Q62_11890 [Campylobacterota bacterium]|nr:hypothetical protein [Campylobacterota bacterium]
MRILLGLFVTALLLLGNEVERIESIVNDVTKLRQNYEGCRAQLAAVERGEGGNSDEKMLALQREIQSQRDLYEREIERMKNELIVSEKKLVLVTRSLKDAKEKKGEYKQHLNAQQQVAGKQKSTQVKTVYVTADAASCPDPNPFPKLLMKKEYTAMKSNGTLKSSAGKEAVEKRTHFKARAFRMKNRARVYDAPKGKVIATWEAKTSFTSGEKEGDWIRITGYFIDKKWRPNRDREMWVEKKNTISR